MRRNSVNKRKTCLSKELALKKRVNKIGMKLG